MKKLLAIFVGVLQLLFYSQPLMADGVIWTLPELISTPNQNASEPQIGVDNAGNAVAVWVENGYVLSSIMPANGSWSASSIISGSGSSSPQLTVDVSGNATAVWVENGVISTASLPFKGSWSGITALSSGGASAPQLTVDTTGNLVAAWVANGVIESVTKLFGASWSSPPDMISSSGMSAPQVTISDKGNVQAVWHNLNSSPVTVLAATKSINGKWSAEQTISPLTYNSAYPKVALDSNGNATAIWFKYQDDNTAFSNVELQAAVCPYNGSWAAPLRMQQQLGLYNPAKLVSSVQYDGNGNAAICWNNSFDGSTFFDSVGILSPDGKLKGILGLLGQDPNAYALNLAVDAFGNAFAVYMTHDRITSDVEVNCRRIDLAAMRPGWSPDFITLSQGAYNGYPQAAARSIGNQIYCAAVWLHSDGVNTTIHAAKGTGVNLAPPSNLAVTQNLNDYFIFKVYYNTLTWNASPSSNVAGYYVLRNGVVVANVPSTAAMQFIDNNRDPSETVIYKVAAYSSSFAQSDVVEITFP